MKVYKINISELFTVYTCLRFCPGERNVYRTDTGKNDKPEKF
jgi:hypothetical protein